MTDLPTVTITVERSGPLAASFDTVTTIEVNGVTLPGTTSVNVLERVDGVPVVTIELLAAHVDRIVR